MKALFYFWKWLKIIVLVILLLGLTIQEFALIGLLMMSPGEFKHPTVAHPAWMLLGLLAAAGLLGWLLYYIGRSIVRILKEKAEEVPAGAVDPKVKRRKYLKIFLEAAGIVIFIIFLYVSFSKFPKMLYKGGHEGSTKGNADSIRSALSIYYGDHQGAWPAKLDPDHWDQCDMSSYIEPLPNAMVWHEGRGEKDSNAVVTLKPDQVPSGPGDGWAYDSTNGQLYVNSNEKDTVGVSYTTY